MQSKALLLCLPVDSQGSKTKGQINSLYASQWKVQLQAKLWKQTHTFLPPIFFKKKKKKIWQVILCYSVGMDGLIALENKTMSSVTQNGWEQ